jgi:DNA-binding transcriptional regulator YbjK
MEKESALKSMEEISDAFNEAVKVMEEQQEAYWNSLTKEQQLDVFCAVARRIHQGDMIDKGSYRYVLYQVFDFGPEAYMPAQMAGYLDIHNAIFTSEQEARLLESFAKFHGLPEDAVSRYYAETH